MNGPEAVGVLGLGSLGIAIAQRLAASGQRVAGWDADPRNRTAAGLQPPAACIAPSLFDLGADCEILLSTLPDIATLKTSLIGDGDRPGAGAAMRPGNVIVHFGGGPYVEVLRLTGLLGTAGVGLVDVFTASGPDAARSGGMELLLGGAKDLVDKVERVLQPLGTSVRIGGPGTATGLAALRGYVRAARLIALSEAMLIGRHAGVQNEILARVFDSPVAAGPQARRLAGFTPSQLRPVPLLAETMQAVADAVEFGERIGLSGECVAFSRDVLAEALDTTGEAADESALLCHLSEVAADAG